MNGLIDLARDFAPELGKGLALSLALLALSSIVGFALATPVALASIARGWAFRVPAWIFTTLLRGSPLFVQIFLIYFGLPMALASLYGGVDGLHASLWWPVLNSPFVLVVAAFSLNVAAYMAEDLRAGLLAIPKGEREAAIASGMSPWTMARRILMPRAIQLTLPTLFNEVVLTLKATALASTVTLRDLTAVGNDLFSLTYDIKAYVLVAIIYLVTVYLLGLIFRAATRLARR